jgi:hypothetical protein
MFHTGAPPEFDNITVLRMCLISKYNDTTCKFSNSGFSRHDLPEDVLSDAGIRMQMTKARPVLAAQAFMRTQNMLNNDLIQCPSTRSTRISRNYTQRPRGAFGEVAAHNTVVEPQLGGRLHWHKTIYMSALTPTILNRLACGPQSFVNKIGNVLESLTHLKVSDDCHRWYDRFSSSSEIDGGDDAVKVKRPRAADIVVPPAALDFDGFCNVAEQKCMLTNLHKHGFSCEKTRKGRFMCRLALPRGSHPPE